jgi:Domain of unknown function (DUF4062)
VEFQGLSAGLLACSVLASLLLTIVRTENPAHIPFRLVLLRALPGMALFVFFWSVVGFAVEESLAALVPAVAERLPLRAALSLLIGIAAPQSAAVLKNKILTPRTATYLRWLQVLDEQTGLYLKRIINREERKINLDFFRVDGERRRLALDRLFEYHNIAIACEELQRHQSPESALGIFKTRQQDVKFKHLLRFLGYSDCLKDLKLVAARPGLLLPTWPEDRGDRRGTKGKGHGGKAVAGRRKYEDPDLQAYVLGFGHPPVEKKYQVFVSSTFLDLRDERQKVQQALLRCGCIPAGMELFPSTDEDLWSLIKAIINDCDYYVLLIGNRYGSLNREGISYTEAEYEYARSRRKPVLAFFHAKPATLPSLEGPEMAARLEEFRARVGTNHTPAYWDNAGEIPALVQQGIEEVKRKHPSRGWVRHETPGP